MDKVQSLEDILRRRSSSPSAIQTDVALPLTVFQGTLPIEYLDNSDQFIAESMWTNAQQILEQFEIKMMQKQQTTLRWLFKPFPELTLSKKEAMIRSVTGLIREGRYDEAVRAFCLAYF